MAQVTMGAAQSLFEDFEERMAKPLASTDVGEYRVIENLDRDEIQLVQRVQTNEWRVVFGVSIRAITMGEVPWETIILDQRYQGIESELVLFWMKALNEPIPRVKDLGLREYVGIIESR